MPITPTKTFTRTGAILSLITAFFAVSTAYAQQAQPRKSAKAKLKPEPDFDFYFLLDKCSTTVGFHVVSDESIKTVPGDPYIWACTRSRKHVDCLISPTSNKNATPKPVKLTIGTDLGTWLDMYSPMYGDYITVNVGQGTAVGMTRIVDTKYTGAKICQGRYMTSDEFNAIIGTSP